MANVLNEFLHGVSKGFQDAAFASFSRRRSTVREDINQSFADASEAPAAAPGQSYLDMLNTSEPAAATASPPALEAPKKRGRKAGSAKPAGAKPAKRGRVASGGRGRGRGGLREV
jgi:hypothetical protein